MPFVKRNSNKSLNKNESYFKPVRNRW